MRRLLGAGQRSARRNRERRIFALAVSLVVGTGCCGDRVGLVARSPGEEFKATVHETSCGATADPQASVIVERSASPKDRVVVLTVVDAVGDAKPAPGQLWGGVMAEWQGPRRLVATYDPDVLVGKRVEHAFDVEVVFREVRRARQP